MLALHEVWFQTRSGPYETCRQVLECVEARQHRPESQGGDNRDAHDGA